MLYFAEHGSAGQTCAQFGISRNTFYRWLHRFDPTDLQSLNDHPTRPTPNTQSSHPVYCPFCRLMWWLRAPSLQSITTLMLLTLLVNIILVLFVLPVTARAASSWNPTLLVNTEAFQTIDDNDTDTDVQLQFGDTLQEKLYFDRGQSRFEFSRSLLIHGDLTSTGALKVWGNMSGASLRVDQNADIWGSLTVSGSAIIDGAATFGSTITVNGVTYTFPSSDGTASGKVLKTDSAGQLSWSDDSTGTSGMNAATAEGMFVNQGGDTMTGALTIYKNAGTATGNILVVDTKGLIYDATNKRVGIGTVTPETALEVIGAMSGQIVRSGAGTTSTPSFSFAGDPDTGIFNEAANNITFSVGGTNVLNLSTAGTASTSRPFIGSAGSVSAPSYTFGGDSNTGMWSNSPDAIDFTTNGNNRLTINSDGNVGIGTTTPNVKLSVAGTASGKILSFGDRLTGSGAVSIRTLLDSTTAFQIFDQDGGNPVFNVDTLNERVGIGTAAPETALEVLGAISGTILRVDQNADIWGGLTVSGSAIIDGAATFGSTITVNGVTYTFPSSDGTASGKVLKTDSAGQLSWSDDSTGTSGMNAATAEGMFVNQGGDTMTGSLTISNSAGLNASGSLLTNTNVTINSDNGGTDAVLTFGNDAGAETIKFNNDTNRFEFSDDLYIQNNLSASGALSVAGATNLQGTATFGSTITVNGVTYTFPSSDGTASGKVLKTDGAGQLSWSDDDGGIGITQDSGDNRYVNTAGDTMTGALKISDATGADAALEVRGIMSGKTIHVTGTGAYPLIFSDGNNHIGMGSPGIPSTVKLDVFGGRLRVVSNNDSYSFAAQYGAGKGAFHFGATDSATSDGVFSNAAGQEKMRIMYGGNVGIGATSPTTKLEVVGTISGAQLRMGNATLSGSIIYSSGSTLMATAKGASGQILLSQGTAAPIWKDPSNAMIWYIDDTLAIGANQGATVTMPFGFTITGIDLKVKTAPTGASLIIDINENGSTIFSTNAEIDASATTEDGNQVFSDTTLAAGSEITLDIDQVGSDVAGANLTVILKGIRNY